MMYSNQMNVPYNQMNVPFINQHPHPPSYYYQAPPRVMIIDPLLLKEDEVIEKRLSAAQKSKLSNENYNVEKGLQVEVKSSK